ncbi:hypothetical protein SAMN04515674_104115 [Pseudarcicella hirudinis]|uniref:Uncharacterized protein n=1 Tax=Pseudarcicella hirudinis TaxID=1079859 RepID=A0A1I5RJU0_9BACT|nr:hypothetical protein SAMN04515674_104115 [Pseudarcicella hirudinis]
MGRSDIIPEVFLVLHQRLYDYCKYLILPLKETEKILHGTINAGFETI